MIIVIIRHGETPQNLRGVFQGQSDPDLDDVGKERFKEIGRLLKDEQWDAIYSSNYKRSVASADFLTADVQVPRFISTEFTERHLGVLDGGVKASLLAADPDLSEKLMTLDYAPFKGELGSLALARFVRGIRTVATEHFGRVVIVSHGGIVALFAHFVLGLPRTSCFLEHGHALVLSISGSEMSLVGMNLPPDALVFNLPDYGS
ncbi:histidine phosphatase family protein [Pseudomonas sp. MAFF 730085]|uniref:Histidine phosphatase family protein n=1 Tax=Pseudomonas kitaguniensis TaxID=2607908 RepID=A0A5N7JZE2_9PSED|nr:histidine phosphatase family protein [Pseudomonas kitaguniensis]MPQ86771.1 histidine phosphatase family protein [Pseudomonas kitaguniensis]